MPIATNFLADLDLSHSQQAIRDSKRAMAIFLWTLYAALCIFHLCLASRVRLPADFLMVSHLFSPLDQYVPWVVFVGISVAFDVFVLVLSLVPQMEGWKWKPTYSPVAKRFYFGTIMYFAISLVVQMFDFVWILEHRSDGLLVALITPV